MVTSSPDGSRLRYRQRARSPSPSFSQFGLGASRRRILSPAPARRFTVCMPAARNPPAWRWTNQSARYGGVLALEPGWKLEVVAHHRSPTPCGAAAAGPRVASRQVDAVVARDFFADLYRATGHDLTPSRGVGNPGVRIAAVVQVAVRRPTPDYPTVGVVAMALPLAQLRAERGLGGGLADDVHRANRLARTKRPPREQATAFDGRGTDVDGARGSRINHC